MIALGGDSPDPKPQAQVDTAFRTGTGVAIVVTLVGAVVLLIPLARRKLGIRTIGRVLLMLDGAVGAGMFVGFVVGLERQNRSLGGGAVSQLGQKCRLAMPKHSSIHMPPASAVSFDAAGGHRASSGSARHQVHGAREGISLMRGR